MDEDEDKIWLAAYGVAMGMLVLGRAVRGDAPDTGEHVDAIDESARLVADRVMKTTKERSDAAAARKAKGARR